ncbi:uncharacterized protein LOC111613841 [Centruroides sculpturatus]|nr:uncharacterized protein LOC111613841 [Centruroides sculpturatus]
MSMIKVLILGACVVAALARSYYDDEFESTNYVPSAEDWVEHSIHRRSAFDSDEPLLRVRRSGHGVVGHVHTYVKTDHDGHFKWGAKHSVGKKYAGHHHH